MTDADCYPKDNQDGFPLWFSISVTGKELSLGYGGYVETDTGILNKLVRFDTFQVALQYLSYALIGKSYMGVGRNIGMTITFFGNIRICFAHIYIPSGDDDLFVREVATSKNVAIAVHRSSQTLSEAITTWSSWFRQKTRYI